MTSVFLHHARTNPKPKARKVSSKDVQYQLFDSDGGFGYFYFTNNETQYNYETTVELSNAKNVKIIYPGESTKLSMTVPPKGSKIVLYEATNFPYSTSMKIASSFSKASAQSNMMKSTLNFGKKTILDNNVTQSVTKHEDGVNIVFENMSRDIYQLYTEFLLEGCHIQGTVGNNITLMIHPRESKNVCIRKDANVRTFRTKILKAEGARIPCFEY